ncbi:MAG: methyltransferase [Peptococcaceae bacterium]|nr:methyltransferase [Peptococcaceae bacterium]
MTVETGETVFSLPGRDLRLALVKNVEALITDPADEDKVPCWAEIWPAARGLAFYVWERLSFAGERLLELGAGLGLPGVVCGLKGARVTFSDFNPMALEISARNALLNGLAQFCCLAGDWRCFPAAGKFDWVVGSDIFYDPRLNIHLAGVIKECLAARGRVLLAHPGRKVSFEFVRGLLADGFRMENEAVLPVHIDDPYFPHYEIVINILSR